MTVILKNGAVFLHIPKTGGAWVTEVLKKLDLVQQPAGHQYADWERVYWNDCFHRDGTVIGQLLHRALGSSRAVEPNCFRFCFVREPLAWYESYWRFMQAQNWKPQGNENDPYEWHPNAMLNGLGSPDFNIFVSNVNNKRPGYLTEFYGWYVTPGIGFVGKQESLEADLFKALALMKIDIDLASVLAVPPVNETSQSIPRPEWDPEVRRDTIRLEYTSYVRFGYPVDEEALA